MTTDLNTRKAPLWKAAAFAALSPALAAPLVFMIMVIGSTLTGSPLLPNSPNVPDNLLLQALAQTGLALYLALLLGATNPLGFASIVIAFSLVFYILVRRTRPRAVVQLALAGVLAGTMFVCLWAAAEIFQWDDSLFN